MCRVYMFEGCARFLLQGNRAHIAWRPALQSNQAEESRQVRLSLVFGVYGKGA